MARVTLRSGEDDDDLAALFAKVAASAGGVPNLYKVLAHAPVLLRGWIDFAWSLRADARSDRGLRELAILRVAQLLDCEYVWRSHWKPALSAGMSEAKLRALARWSERSQFSEAERALLRLTDELCMDAQVGDATFAALRAAFDEQESVELVLTIAWYCCAARVASGLEVPLERAHERVPSLASMRTEPEGTA